jgi:hypothetical protein
MPDPLPEDVRAAIAAGRTLDAIKLLRRAKGVGLKEAKALADEAGRTLVRQRGQAEGLSPGEVPRRGGWALVAAAVLALLGLAAWLAGAV